MSIIPASHRDLLEARVATFATVGAKYGADLRVHDRPGERRVLVTLHLHKANGVHIRG